MVALIVVLALVVLLILGFIIAYNGLIRLRNRVENAWAQIDVQLKRRHDLIPNLIETAKGYMTHEKETLENITKARNLAQGASGVGESANAESQVSSALGSFFLVVENYPDLKANQNFLELQEELSSTENKIGFSRQFYNDSVMKYNTKREVFPSNIVAGMGTFPRREFFELRNAEERKVPKVQF